MMRCSVTVMESDTRKKTQHMLRNGQTQPHTTTQQHTSPQTHISVQSQPLPQPHPSAVDAAGNVYVADTNNNRIVKLTSNSTVCSSCLRCSTIMHGWNVLQHTGAWSLCTTSRVHHIIASSSHACDTRNHTYTHIHIYIYIQ